ncbi:MAG: DUF3006 domain-containing protein [Prevotella sp.]|nr:DUF3006 domain-containing protein [Prevotella sp.]
MLIIDRIEDGIAVVETEDGRMEVPRSELAPDIKEGDVVELADGIYVKNQDETDMRRKKIIELQNSLWE